MPVMHLDMDCFFVSVERLLDPSLVDVPVVVGGDPSGRGVVCSASYEAREFGVRSAMPMGLAMRLCPRARRVPPRGPYSDFSRRVRAILDDLAPVVVPLSIDEFACDLAGCERLYTDGLFAACQAARERIGAELGLPSTFALASNGLVAKIAAGQVKPDGATEVPCGQESAFLAPLPVRVLPGVGPKMMPWLEGFGVRTVGHLVRLGKPLLERKLGKHGVTLWERAHGRVPDRLGGRQAGGRKSIGHETTFARDVDDPEVIRRALSRLSEEACRGLRRGGWRAATITLKLRYADFKTISRSRTIPPTDLDTDVFPVVDALWREACDGRRVRLRLVGVRLSGLSQGGAQGLLFDDQGPRQQALLSVADQLASRYGRGTVRFGRSLDVAREEEARE